MAYRNDPRGDTYSQHTLPSCYTLEVDPSTAITYLDASIGSGMQNMVPLSYTPVPGDAGTLYSTNRPALDGAVIDSANTSGMKARGVYVWEKTSALTYYYAVVGVRVYTSTDGSTWTHRDTLLTSATTPVGFTEFINSATNAKSLVLVDGVEGYVYTSDAAGTKITDAEFPTPHLPFPVYLDGYLFLAKKDTGDIYNSDLNSTTAWTAGNFISSEQYPDDVQAITKVGNYLLAIGLHGCEYFYDAANATGSPLRRVDGASLPFGTFFPYTIASNKDTVVMVANMNDGEPGVVRIKGQQWEEVTPDFLMPIFVSVIEDGLSGITGADYWGYFVRSHGDLFYCISLGANIASGRTFAFSMRYNVWCLFTITSDSSYGQSNFPVTRATQGTRAEPVTFVIGYINSLPFFAKFSEGSNGVLMYGNDLIDNSGLTGPGGVDTLSMQCAIVTPRMTFGTLNLKTMSRFGVNGEQVPLVAMDAVNEKCAVSWYDFPGGLESTTPKYLSLHESLSEPCFPFITQLGAFRKRRVCVQLFPKGGGIVVYSLECDINKGVQ